MGTVLIYFGGSCWSWSAGWAGLLDGVLGGHLVHGLHLLAPGPCSWFLVSAPGLVCWSAGWAGVLHPGSWLLAPVPGSVC